MKNFNSRLIEALDYTGHTQLDLANYLGCHKTVVNSWVKGKAKLPKSIDDVIKIARFLNVNPSWLCGFTDIKDDFNIDERELKLLKNFKRLSEENKTIIENMVKALPKDERRNESVLKTA